MKRMSTFWLLHDFTHSFERENDKCCVASGADLRRRQHLRDVGVQQAGQQGVAQDVCEVLGHDGLLLQPTVVLQGQDEREVGGLAEETHTLNNKEPLGRLRISSGRKARGAKRRHPGSHSQ